MALKSGGSGTGCESEKLRFARGGRFRARPFETRRRIKNVGSVRQCCIEEIVLERLYFGGRKTEAKLKFKRLKWLGRTATGLL